MTTPDNYCVFGNPIGHSRSPWIHQRFAQLTGQNLDYQARLAPLDGFADSLRDFIAQGGKGANVTVPFKHDAARCGHTCSQRVVLAGGQRLDPVRGAQRGFIGCGCARKIARVNAHHHARIGVALVA